ncbi:F0F1 ATP synthase subunit B family protein [Desulfopila inferna]|uniref:F0F1 ATP synthase subunit B family protein n=1 Tax=Desulfopila inferna TaxID=468528 RepID=UPI00196587D1|nr:ATP synthase F0 subunit B [Desulfopila inferna]MBM9605114.1 ATP synthase F0 subunit B [Desulfopila inferna]
MRGVKHITSGLFLVAVALCFSLSVGNVWAVSGDSHAAVESAGHGVASTALAVEDGHAAEGATTEAHGGGSLAPDKLWDLFFRILNFAVLVFILVKFGAKPIASGLAGRQQKIKDDIEDLEARKVEAEKTYRDFEAKLAGMEREIDTIVDKAIAQAEIEKAKIIEKAEQAAKDIKRQAEMSVQNEIMIGRRQLKNDIADQAAAMAEQLIVKNLTSEDQVKIIEDYLDKVGAVQ